MVRPGPAEQAQAQLAAIVTSCDDAIISKTLDGIITTWNAGAERIFGYAPQEVIGQSILRLIPPEMHEEEERIIARITAGQRIEHYETERLTKDGQRIPVSLTMSPIKDMAGTIIGASKIARDITERKRSEAAIRDLNAQLSADLSAMTRMQAISTRLVQAEDFGQLLDEIVAAGTEITGADMGNIQLFQNGVLQIVSHRGFEPPFLEFFNRVSHGSAACGTALERCERVIVQDVRESTIFTGTPALDVMLAAGALAVQSTPLISRSGKPLGMFSTHYRTPRRPGDRELRMLDLLARQAADLIERTQAEAAQRASEKRFRFMAESMPQKIFTNNAAGEADYLNQQWVDYTGVPLSELIGKGWARFLHPDDAEETLRRWQQSVDTKESFELIHRFRRADGMYRWHLSRAHAMPDERLTGSFWIGSNTDIHDERETGKQLERTTEELKHFAYAASHDLQEPLRMVTVYAQLLAKECKGRLGPGADQYIDYAVQGAQRMDALLKGMRDYWQAGERGEHHAVSTDTNRMLEQALLNLQESIKTSGATITHDQLPTVLADETAFVQVFQNLIGNAIKYSGDQPPRVHITAARNNDDWLFSVKDDGIGIHPRYADKVFVVFNRLNGNKYPGSGIGLSLCRKVIEHLGGTIWVESTPGQGATFKFTIPCRE